MFWSNSECSNKGLLVMALIYHILCYSDFHIRFGRKNLQRFDIAWNIQSFMLKMRTAEVCWPTTHWWGALQAQDCVLCWPQAVSCLEGAPWLGTWLTPQMTHLSAKFPNHLRGNSWGGAPNKQEHDNGHCGRKMPEGELNCSPTLQPEALRKHGCPARGQIKRVWGGRGNVWHFNRYFLKLPKGNTGTGCEPSHAIWSKCRLPYLVSEFLLLLSFCNSWVYSTLCC